MNRFGLVQSPNASEADMLRKNYSDAIKRLLEFLKPEGVFGVRTRIERIVGSYASGDMRLGVYPHEINFPTASAYQCGDCFTFEDDESQVSEADRHNAMMMRLAGTVKLHHPSDIDLILRRRQLLSRSRSPITEKGTEKDVFLAIQAVFDEHGIYIDLHKGR